MSLIHETFAVEAKSVTEQQGTILSAEKLITYN
jgi:hypothetical protein